MFIQEEKKQLQELQKELGTLRAQKQELQKQLAPYENDPKIIAYNALCEKNKNVDTEIYKMVNYRIPKQKMACCDHILITHYGNECGSMGPDTIYSCVRCGLTSEYIFHCDDAFGALMNDAWTMATMNGTLLNKLYSDIPSNFENMRALYRKVCDEHPGASRDEIVEWMKEYQKVPQKTK